MAAPPEITLKNLSGHYILNKPISGDPDPVLALQGIGWLIRKAISVMPVQLIIKNYQDDQGFWHFDIEQPGAAGISGTTELRTVDGKEAHHKDHIFGAVDGVTNWIKVSDLKDDDEDEKFLKDGWLDEELIDNQVKSVGNGWTARQVWGFQEAEVNGQKIRMYARNIIVWKKDKVQRVKFFYDYKPAN
ncbi:uncharacterized protein PV09_01752 [Verruconis gallopava]|uniref:Uncharacterized protein n=1 Tax=Verruconis gallopava TaxID=253628 RepID=A0A0D2B9A6_9PEZI|nr:uncharacterized protein PV09_01752 [Verruconis gallopava]KIW07834.1 hypothetical protein PV09_01752 [Verruconis gallopava]